MAHRDKKRDEEVGLKEQLDLWKCLAANRRDQGAQYALHAVLLHNGATRFQGHYAALVRVQQQWWLLDDHRAVMVPVGQVLKQQKHAYMLYYVKQTNAPPPAAQHEDKARSSAPRVTIAAEPEPRPRQSVELPRKSKSMDGARPERKSTETRPERGLELAASSAASPGQQPEHRVWARMTAPAPVPAAAPAPAYSEFIVHTALPSLFISSELKFSLAPDGHLLLEVERLYQLDLHLPVRLETAKVRSEFYRDEGAFVLHIPALPASASVGHKTEKMHASLKDGYFAPPAEGTGWVELDINAKPVLSPPHLTPRERRKEQRRKEKAERARQDSASAQPRADGAVVVKPTKEQKHGMCPCGSGRKLRSCHGQLSFRIGF